MKLLPILGGLFCKVDDEDFNALIKYNWHLSRRRINKFYIVRSNFKDGKNIKIYLHREIMKAKKGQLIDHIDRDVLNNQKSNLRFCSYSENNKNMGKKRGGTSIYKGVSYCKFYNKWIAKLDNDGQLVLNKRFKSEIDAAIAYDNSCKEFHGEFAVLNFPKI